MRLTQEEKAIAVLDEAVNVIKEFGWHQGSYGSRDAGFCLMGACDTAAVRLRMKGTLGAALSEVRVVLDEPALGAWNDDPKRTKRQVLAALRKASKSLHLRFTS